MRRAPLAAVALAGVLAAACGRTPAERLRVVDLLEYEAAAEKRPAGGPFAIGERTCGGVSRTTLATPPESRVIWQLALPARGLFTSGAAVEGEPGAVVTFRVGISDDRIYEPLHSVDVTADACGRAWVPIAVDLGRYAGVKFSIFYRPDRKEWRLVLGTNTGGGQAVRAHWARPAIETDSDAAKAYLARVRPGGRLR